MLITPLGSLRGKIGLGDLSKNTSETSGIVKELVHF
jgi:hypothetical protein